LTDKNTTDVAVSGIVDLVDNRAVVRTDGYLPGPDDIHLSRTHLDRSGLRRGDLITGTAAPAAPAAPSGGRAGAKRGLSLVRVDTVNGLDPREATRRPDFYQLTALYPQERLRLETDRHQLTNRVIDLVMPIGKGQRALIVSPPKAGKTVVLQAIAAGIAHNHPECDLMVVLVDERPEEVTDMRRSVRGEVVASPSDRPPRDHTAVAELALERARRLVELGRDVVVLIDSITRLGRAYNLAARNSGRVLSGGIDSSALLPPKRLLTAGRNVEGGGSLTVIATALVEAGSLGDTVFFEEFKGTGNAELKLDRTMAERRIYPAIDIRQSGTRREELLLAPDELTVVRNLRRALSTLDSGPALEQLLDRLRATGGNAEFLAGMAGAIRPVRTRAA
jgi:transcription termination factor Rho